MKFKVADSFTTIHNYIDLESMILRKGAISSKAGERVLIPINMRSRALTCSKGKTLYDRQIAYYSTPLLLPLNKRISPQIPPKSMTSKMPKICII